jgi:hypothetical protein
VQRNVSLRVRECFEYEYVQDGVCRTCSDGFLIQDRVSESSVHSLAYECGDFALNRCASRLIG